MEKIIKYWKELHPLGRVCVIISLLALYSLIFGAYEYRRGWNNAVNSIEKDTAETSIIIKWDTIEVDKPVPVTQYLVRYKTDTLPIIKHDTIDNTAIVEIPITQQKYHQDSLYTAWVSGFKPSLDSIKVYPKTVTNTTTITRTLVRKPKISLSAGLSYGYSINSKKFEPQVGITVGIPIKNIY